ncbi:MAG: DUF4861 family protein [Alphaproteobacteria bacterium]|nr:DUF4861 family protein [Alphaproteobacteria bacterium]
MLRDNMATQVGDMKRMSATIADSGPVIATMRIVADGFVVDRRACSLTASYTIAAGSRLFMVSASASPRTPLVAGFGKYPYATFFRSAGKSGWGCMADRGAPERERQGCRGGSVVLSSVWHRTPRRRWPQLLHRFQGPGAGALRLCGRLGEGFWRDPRPEELCGVR